MKSRRPLPALLPFLLALLAARFAPADAYDPPANYYSTATGTGATLKSQLHDIIDNHTVISYSNVPAAFALTDLDPNNSNNILTVYDRTSVTKVYSNNPLLWNREHTWPRSRGVGDTGPDDSDLFNLRPALVSNNGDRGNLNFGGAYGLGWGVVTDKGSSKWSTGMADAGMTAREMFYMAVRYDGSDASTTNLELFAGNPSTSQGVGDLDRLLEWHFAAPPDDFERRRNNVIYTNYQHNRDPFIDNPELVWSVFVDQANDSRLAWQGATVDANGAGPLTVDFGRRIVGSALPAAQSITLNKTGADGTYFRVTPAGAATSSLSGKFNAFRTNDADSFDSRAITIGLSGSTTTAGLKTGTVTVDNLDVTTGGGAGRGANDANDVLTANLSLLDHANPSFFAGSDVNARTIDFGSIAQGSAAPTFSFDLFNLQATAGFTAGLDLDSITPSGDFATLSTNLATFGGASPLPAGQSSSFTATLDTSAMGTFSAVYTLSFSDENVVGAAALGNLVLTLTGSVSPASIADADFNGDGEVDGSDLLVWQAGLGMESGATLADGDANADGAVNDLDLAVWQSQVPGAESQLAPVPVPEPASSTLLAACGLAIFRSHGRARRSTPGHPAR